MKEKIKLLVNNKHIFVILIILLILLIGTAGTYAWFTWSNPSNTNLSITIGDLDIVFGTGNDINITNLTPVFYPTEGAKTSFTIKKNNTSISSIAYNISLDVTTISSELKSDSLKWAITNKDTSTVLASGNFSNVSNGTSINLYDAALTGTTASYDFYIYIDANIENSSSMMNKTLTGTINIGGTKEQTLATYITNLYTSAAKTTVTNNSITYNYATSVSLMNDRLGSSSTDINGGNIRYYGASPNNYIYFNCEDYSNQSSSTCEVWRIIGVFNGKVKIIKNGMINELAWDQDKNIDSSLTTYDNDWSTSSLQVLLNEKYYNGNTVGTITYYSGSSGGTSTSLNLASIGIKNDTTRNLISTETYYLRGYNNNSVYVDAMYNYERTAGSVYSGRPTSWTGKIALAYPSDYGYAADFNYCTQTLYNYDNSTCTSNNWLKSILGISSYGWLLTPNSSSASNAWRVYSSGNVYSNYYAYGAGGVAPVLFLNSVLTVKTGTGESTNPYQLLID